MKKSIHHLKQEFIQKSFHDISISFDIGRNCGKKWCFTGSPSASFAAMFSAAPIGIIKLNDTRQRT